MSFLSHISPVPAFPPYSGPYNVGSQDVEIPVTDLSSTPGPDPAITTVNFRLFYPCAKPKKHEHVYWLPEPQTEYWQAYARFLRASPFLASLLSYIPIVRLIFYTAIPASRDAQVLRPSSQIGKWPVMVFSHGLGGTKNAYSHICGSLASHGLVIAALDHRDGSAPTSFIRGGPKGSRRQVDYKRIAQEPSQANEEARNHQLAIRCWEIGLAHSALLEMDNDEPLTNYRNHDASQSSHLSTFARSLDIHTPGSISWAGHSFGAATMIQFVKSIFYGGSPLYTANPSSPINQQITPASSLTLLDLWAQPLLSSATSSLWSKPLPAYAASTGTGAAAPLAILSESFFKWKANLATTIRAISPPQGQFTAKGLRPHIFYPTASAHLSQSDFGALFPWVTKKLMKAADPEATLRLNVRAILESLRRSGVKVAETGGLNKERDGAGIPSLDGGKEVVRSDYEILSTDGKLGGWIAVDVQDSDDGRAPNGDVMDGNNKERTLANDVTTNGHAIEAEDPQDAVMKGEIMK